MKPSEFRGLNSASKWK